MQTIRFGKLRGVAACNVSKCTQVALELAALNRYVGGYACESEVYYACTQLMNALSVVRV